MSKYYYNLHTNNETVCFVPDVKSGQAFPPTNDGSMYLITGWQVQLTVIAIRRLAEKQTAALDELQSLPKIEK